MYPQRDREKDKRDFIQRALAGEPRPKNSTAEGRLLARYLSRGKRFDPAFRERLRAANPSWVGASRACQRSRKAELLALAQAGAPRPRADSPLGNALRRYLKPYRGIEYMYDPMFAHKIKRLRPEWDVREQRP